MEVLRSSHGPPAHWRPGKAGGVARWMWDLRIREAKAVELRAPHAAPAQSELALALFLVCPGPKLIG